MATKKEYSDVLLTALQKMRELKCPKTEIYTMGVGSPLISPTGASYKTSYVKVFRVTDELNSGIQIQCCIEGNPSFILSANNELEASEAVEWMSKNNCLPSYSAMCKLVIPAITIQL